MRRFAVALVSIVPALALVALLATLAAACTSNDATAEGFYAEIRVEVDPPADDPLAGTGSFEGGGVIRWWYASEPDRWRWEIELGGSPIDEGTLTTVFDGEDSWGYDDRSNTFQRTDRQSLPPGTVMLPISNIPVGPAGVASVDAFMTQWRDREPGRDVRLAGEEDVLGRTTQVIEIRPAWHSSSSGTPPPGEEREDSGGVVRAYIDPERMFVMRWAVDGEGGGQSYRAEVTRLDYDTSIDPALFTFEPPAGARRTTPSDPASCRAAIGSTVGAPVSEEPGFLTLTQVPSGLAVRDTGFDTEFGTCEPAGSRTLLESEEGTSVLFSQRRRVNIPAGVHGWQPVDVGGLQGYRSAEDGVERLAWQDGEVVALLESTALPFEELLRIAESAELVSADTITASPVGTATASPTAAATPPPTSTSPPAVGTPIVEDGPFESTARVNGAMLIDVASGQTHVLHRSAEWNVFLQGFEPDGTVWVLLSQFQGGESTQLWQRFDLDGRVIEEREDRPDLGPSHCAPPVGALDVELPDAAFGQGVWALAPDCSKALLYANVENNGIPGAQQAYWLLDIASGDLRLLTDEARSCGGCDGVFGAAWSPSGRYLIYAETYSGPGGSRIWLTDVETGETRLLGEEPTTGFRINQVGNNPSWAPDRDALLLPEASGGSVIESVPSGQKLALPELGWPARFDPSGNYVYSGVDGVTVIADATTGEILRRWDGVPALRWWEGWGTEPEAVIATSGGPAAILADARPGYVGIVGHHPALSGGVAIFDNAARGAVWSPGGERIAFADRGEPELAGEWAIFVLDVRTGELSDLAAFDPGLDLTPPKIIWNDAGTHLLVQWPGPSGI